MDPYRSYNETRRSLVCLDPTKSQAEILGLNREEWNRFFEDK
jgi:hypothetical protein